MARNDGTEKKGLRVPYSVLFSVTLALLAVGGWIGSVTMARERVEDVSQKVVEQGEAIQGHGAALMAHKEEIEKKVNTEKYDVEMQYLKASIDEMRADIKKLLARQPQ